jgi:hypothetical protein
MDPLMESRISLLNATIAACSASTGLSRVDMARRLRMSKASLYSKLKGDSAWTSVELLLLSDMLGVSMNDLFSGLGGRLPLRPASNPVDWEER